MSFESKAEDTNNIKCQSINWVQCESLEKDMPENYSCQIQSLLNSCLTLKELEHCKDSNMAILSDEVILRDP